MKDRLDTLRGSVDPGARQRQAPAAILPLDAPPVSIILVNWNGLADTRECLASLSQIDYPNARVIVVDNGSRGSDAAALRSEFPGVTVLETGENLGFTGGNNVGIRQALADGAAYLLCLNNDTMVAPDFLGLLVQALEEDPDAGIATSAIYYHDRPDRLSALGCQVDLSQMDPVRHITAVTDLALDAGRAEVAAVDGCVLMMRRAVAEQTGGFDDSFFAYVEDADLCLRARRQGWRCLAVPASAVWHKVGSTTGGEYSPTAIHYYTRNSYRLVSRHGSVSEQAEFRRKVREGCRNALNIYINGTRSEDRGETVRETQRALDYAVNTKIGALGRGGSRKSYRALEAALRAGTTLRFFLARLLVSPCRWCARAYSRFPVTVFCHRVYWKLYSMRRAAREHSRHAGTPAFTTEAHKDQHP